MDMTGIRGYTNINPSADSYIFEDFYKMIQRFTLI